MKLTSFFLAAALLSDAAIGALVVPPSAELTTVKPVQHKNKERDETAAAPEELWKRRGGGGGGGRGGGGGGGSRGGSGGSGRGSSGSRPAVTPAYGGGRFFGGGAAQPYRAGSRSPSGIAPVFFAGSLLVFWPGIWYHGAHIYHFERPYEFYNATTQRTERKPVECACAPNADCGCDENPDKDYLDDLIGNGSYAALNKTLIDVANVNGTSTILLNGTLPDGTAAAVNGAGDGLRGLLHHVGWWPVVATVCAIAFTA
ncbi:hypothetical protein P885DRAFT_75502 [Corynascus similis CBS 632.67]